jgi:SOS response regulatory protein OraA/RecX
MADASLQALEAGIKALSRRELSRDELVARLERSGIDREDAERASSQLAEAGYQSDERTAGERARVLAGRLHGDLAIRVDLGRRGLSEADIDAALEGIETELARAEALSRRVGGGEHLARTLHRKGYSEDAIDAALRIAGARE